MFKVNFYGFYAGFDKYDNFILDAIKKVGQVEVTDDPDYVFFSVFSNEYLLYPNAVRIFFTGENIAPNFQLCDYAIGFERLDFGDRYLRFPFYYGLKEYSVDVQRAQTKHKDVRPDMFERKFCSFVYSNADTDCARTSLYKELSLYKTVDAGGKLFNNISECVTDKWAFERDYKFSVACENSSHLGYCTEKILQSFGACTVPIYYGDVSVGQDFNENAFVNCHAFKNLSDAVEYVKYLDQNRDAYLKTLQEHAFMVNDFAQQMQNQFEKFIAAIFVQQRDMAFRRNRFFWGKRMDEKYLKIYKLERVVRKITGRSES